MNSRIVPFYFRHKAICIGSIALVMGVILEFIAILSLNSGHFVYTLDDAYVHLALAENIRAGHYGINAGEFSAPSSSILWPFILAAFAGRKFGEFFPFFINLMSAIGTLFLFHRILGKSILIESAGTKSTIIAISLIFLILGTNIIGLIFTGMEHSLQLLFVAAIIWGLILEIETRKVVSWLPFALVMAPLIRYENLALCLAGLLYLLFRRYYKLSIILTITIVLSLGAFTIFLMNLGLPPLPASILLKSTPISSGGNAATLWSNFKNNLGDPSGILLAVGMLFMISFALLSGRKREERLLAGSVSLAIIMHLLVGRFGWYNRYEIYIWAGTILVMLYLGRHLLSESLGNRAVLKFAIIGALWTAIICAPYVKGLTTIRLASNNIYEQQYQMHRFAADYYKKPVAVNDIGYISYRNDNFVLDLWGLASREAQNLKKNNENSEWMNELCQSHNVRLAMIYEKWFKKVPANWHKLGELHLGKRRITPADSVVSLFALNNGDCEQLYALLKTFKTTLPHGVALNLTEEDTR